MGRVVILQFTKGFNAMRHGNRQISSLQLEAVNTKNHHLHHCWRMGDHHRSYWIPFMFIINVIYQLMYHWKNQCISNYNTKYTIKSTIHVVKYLRLLKELTWSFTEPTVESMIFLLPKGDGYVGFLEVIHLERPCLLPWTGGIGTFQLVLFDNILEFLAYQFVVDEGSTTEVRCRHAKNGESKTESCEL